MLMYPHIDPVALHLGPIQIRWYGLMYVLGFTIGWMLLKSRMRATGLQLVGQQPGDLLTYVFMGVLAGGRLGYVLFYNPVYYATHPLEILQFWGGGMSFHGGMIGVVIAGYWFCKRRGIDFYRLTDTVMPIFPICLGLGRLGNFINGELWGRPADVPWAMVFPADPSAMPRHPSQLYELGMEGILLGAILWTMAALKLPSGAQFWAFMACYGLFRVIGEQFREPDAHLSYIFAHVSAGMIVSTPMLVIGTVMLVLTLRKRAATKTESLAA